jgi:hypothetical protein
MHPLDFFYEKDHGRVNHAIEEVFTHGSGSVEAELVTKNKMSSPIILMPVTQYIMANLA